MNELKTEVKLLVMRAQRLKQEINMNAPKLILKNELLLVKEALSNVENKLMEIDYKLKEDMNA